MLSITIFIRFLTRLHPVSIILNHFPRLLAITETDIYDALEKLETSKVMGPNGIPSIMFSRCASAIYKPFYIPPFKSNFEIWLSSK